MRIKSLIAIALVLGAPFVPTAPAAADIKVLCASGIQGGEIADVAILPRIVLDQVAADGNVVA